MRIALPPVISRAALADRDPRAAIVDLGGETMGTRWSVRLAAPAGVDLAAVRAGLVVRLDGIVAQMSQWEPTSLLSRFNRAAAGTWTILPPDVAAVIEAGLRIAAATGGAFDPAIGRLVDLWGFGPIAVAGAPDEAAIEMARQVSGWRRLAWRAVGRCLYQPGGLALDLAGIAKGYAVDAVADLLATLGIRHCLVEIGGELVGRGVRPDGEPWWVDLEAPPGLAVPPLRVALHGLAVATSGNYRRGDHTLDPRTGRPVANGVVAASVVAATALAADAWATALTVLGPAAAMAVAEREDIAARLVTVANGEAVEQITPALAAMLGG